MQCTCLQRVSKNLGFSCMRILRLLWIAPTRYLITAVDILLYISLTCSNWLIIRIQFINDSWRWLQYLLFAQRLWAISPCSQNSVAWALHSFNFILGIKNVVCFQPPRSWCYRSIEVGLSSITSNRHASSHIDHLTFCWGDIVPYIPCWRILLYIASYMEYIMCDWTISSSQSLKLLHVYDCGTDWYRISGFFYLELSLGIVNTKSTNGSMRTN